MSIPNPKAKAQRRLKVLGMYNNSLLDLHYVRAYTPILVIPTASELTEERSNCALPCQLVEILVGPWQ